VQALGELQDRESLPALRKLLTHEDPDVRRCAARALARLGDEESAAAILKMADSAAGWERTHATGLCHSLAEHLAAVGKKEAAGRIYTHLRDTRTDPDEQHVKAAATRALEALK
jgi:HEAT repeat protein